MASNRTSSTKQALRTQLQHRRQALSPGEQTRAKRQLATIICTRPEFQRSQRIALYCADGGEIDPRHIAQIAWQRGKHCYLPIRHPVRSGYLLFGLYQPDTRLIKNCWGILEPVLTSSGVVPPWRLDLVLMPLVGFDQQGNRLGRGGGFYDRTFAFKRTRTAHYRKPVLLGLAHECQKVAVIPLASWDLPMAGVATDAQFYPNPCSVSWT